MRSSVDSAMILRILCVRPGFGCVFSRICVRTKRAHVHRPQHRISPWRSIPATRNALNVEPSKRSNMREHLHVSGHFMDHTTVEHQSHRLASHSAETFTSQRE